MKSIGLVLSGGGARGAAHIGVLQALDELAVKPSAISGVSAGAVIGALYAAGYTPQNILAELKRLSYFGITNVAWLKNGLFSMAGLRKSLGELIEHNDFERLKVKLFVTATDISMAASVTFLQGPLIDPIVASCSVPVVFEPVSFAGYQLLDGGILNNLPVETLMGKYDVIIGSHVNKLYDGKNPARLTKISLIDQCFHIAIAERVKQQATKCNVFIEPDMAGYGMFDMKNADKLFELGYLSTMEQKDKLRACVL